MKFNELMHTCTPDHMRSVTPLSHCVVAITVDAIKATLCCCFIKPLAISHIRVDFPEPAIVAHHHGSMLRGVTVTIITVLYVFTKC